LRKSNDLRVNVLYLKNHSN